MPAQDASRLPGPPDPDLPPDDDPLVTVVCDAALDERDPLVSVCTVTYNQKNHVQEAIESVLRQETRFDYELIVGDDCSTDGTREVLRRYQQAHPERIRLNLHERHYDAGVPGRKNMVTNLRTARGKYVAILDGDDYWMSPDKLERQAEFLERHLRYSMSFHNAYMVFEAGVEGMGQDAILQSERHPEAMGNDGVFDLEAMMYWGRGAQSFFVPSGSMMLRRQCVDPVPDWFWYVWDADRALQMHCARQGPVYYHADLFSCYRRTARGIMARFDGELHQVRRRLQQAEVFAEQFPRYRQRRSQFLNPLYRTKARLHWRNGQWRQAAQALLRSLYHHVQYRARRAMKTGHAPERDRPMTPSPRSTAAADTAEADAPGRQAPELGVPPPNGAAPQAYSAPARDDAASTQASDAS
jgi:glycosyltransferase involved in cell wall biosynthesis